MTKVLTEIVNLQKNIRQPKHTDFEDAMEKQLQKLKAELSFIYNSTIREAQALQGGVSQSTAQSIAEEQLLGKKKAPGQDGKFYSDFDSNVYKASLVNGKSGSGNLAMRVRRDIGDLEYEDHLNDFRSEILEKVYAIQGSDGDYKYYIIPKGSSLEQEVMADVKIFCSSYVSETGRLVETDEGLKDLGEVKGREKYERDKQKGFTEFTLKERALKLIEKEGKDITNIVHETQIGNYPLANSLAQSVKNTRLDNIKKSTELSQSGKNLTPAMEALGKGNQSIQGLKVRADKYKGTTVGYNITVTTSNNDFYVDKGSSRWNLREGDSPIMGVDETFGTMKDAIDSLRTEVNNDLEREAKIWANESAGILTTAILKTLNKVIKDFNKAK